MDKINDIFIALARSRNELTNPLLIWQLAKYLKKNTQPLRLDASNDSLLLPGTPGLYYLEAKFDFNSPEELEQFAVSWGKIRAENPPNSIPRYYPDRAKRHVRRIQRNCFVPFYLGKSKNIRDRIVNHMDSPEASGTYSLKLRSRPDLMRRVELRYSYYELDIDLESYFGVELLEVQLRKLLNPVVGKQ